MATKTVERNGLSGLRDEAFAPAEGHRWLDARIVGVAPLLMNNGQKANPHNPLVKGMKAITGKHSKKRTEDDLAELIRLEWLAGLYYQDGRPVIPGSCVESMMVEAARKTREGQQVTAGVLVPEDHPLVYDGPKDVESLFGGGASRWVDSRGAGVQKARVWRTRPIFPEWSLCFRLGYLPDLLSESDIGPMLAKAGQIIGLGDYRPRYGRFTVAYCRPVK